LICRTRAWAKLDIVVVAVHSYLDLPREVQTDRVIRAMNNRHVSIIAHPTGRLIGERKPYDIDMGRVIAAAHDLGCHLEANSQPDRLDLNDNYVQAAKQAGVTLAIATDTHSVDAFECIRFRVDQARRGWLTADGSTRNRWPIYVKCCGAREALFSRQPTSAANE
jgi:DNA polymerase (family 10)